MNIYLLSRNADLSSSIERMLADPALGLDLSCVESMDEIGEIGSDGSVLLIDADVPASECMVAMERLDSNLADMAAIVIVGTALADRHLPGFDNTRHLVSPFHKSELLTSIAAESEVAQSGRQILRIGRLTLNLSQRKAFVDDMPVPLTRKEYEVLQLLALRRGVTLSKEMFLDKLYGGLDEPEVKIIDVFVCKIRGKLKKLTDGDGLIDTVWGRGYVLRDPETRHVQHREPERAAG
jgi:two-component system cell cycle response regulator CtrA